MDVSARCQRSGGGWAVDVPEVPGAFTQAKRLDQVPAQAADAVALLLDVPASSVRVTVTVDVAGVDEVRARQADAERATREAGDAMRALVRRFREDGLTVRDIGVILGVSPQRAQQLAAEARLTAPA